MYYFKSDQALTVIEPYLPPNPIILEAGAFDGSDTIRMAKKWPSAMIYAFEPVPELYARLKNNTYQYPNIHCYQIALSNTNGTAPFYISEKSAKPGIPSQAGSLLSPKDRLRYSSMQFPYTIQVPTITLDSWAQQHSISRIDCAWLDMQGHELNVLQASNVILPSLKAIYSEVGFYENYANQPIYTDVKKWLEAHNFKEAGKNFLTFDDHFFGNVLFVRNLQ